jgi:predicted aminopeptidase
MKILKWILLVTLILLLGFILTNLRLVGYGISQAKGQLQIIREARPIKEVMEDPLFPDSLKTNLSVIHDIRKFAFDSLGIKPSDNYTTVFDQKGKELMFVVTACDPFRLEPKEWSFPIIGTFSYKGYFDENKAQLEESKLKADGLDTNIRTAGGWSTLGWFKDPILSNMLAEPEADFAETIIHELTHGTLFVKDSLRFNENLATFFGMMGSTKYLVNKYGEQSDLVKHYRDRWTNRKVLSGHILRGANHLDSLYATFTEEMHYDEKSRRKEKAINQIIESIDTLPLNNKETVIKYYLALKPNNTFFMSFLRYRGDYELLEVELNTRFDGNLKLMLDHYKKTYPSL